MPCTACGLHAKDVRAYARIAELNRAGAPEPIHLCAACRVLNALNPQYVPLHATALQRAHDSLPAAASDPGSQRWSEVA